MWIVLGFLAGCFALGMAGGILFANLAYPCRNGQNQILELYALTQIKKKEGKSTEYFWYLLENRMFTVLFFLLTGLTGAAHFVVVAAAAWMGFLAGAAGSILILELGLEGFRIFCRFFISAGFCIFSCSCTVDDKNLQRRGKYLEETGKNNKNLFSDRSDRNDSVSFRCCS